MIGVVVDWFRQNQVFVLSIAVIMNSLAVWLLSRALERSLKIFHAVFEARKERPNATP